MAAGQYTMQYEQMLNPVRGWHVDHNCLTHAAQLAASVLEAVDSVPAGRVVHVNSDGEFELGGSGTDMPMYLWHGSHDGSVRNSGQSPVTDVYHWRSNMGKVGMEALVATGGYEVQSTEFDTEQTYRNNDLLTADSDGVLTTDSVVQYDTWVCGVCAPGKHQAYDATPATTPVATNANGVSVLTFWTYFLPAAAA